MRLAMAFLVVLGAARPLLACSAFAVDGAHGPLIGKGYDWSGERGLVLVNPSGLDKRALTLSPADTPAAWHSRYSSLTFNQYGRELPNGGLNEAGLVVEVLVLEASTLPARDARPALTELGMVQFLLDQAASTAEAVALAGQVRVARGYAKLHYFVCDRAGACATIEYIDGKLVVSTGPVRALTNSPYSDSLSALKRHPAAKTQSSLDRFVRVATGLQSLEQPSLGQASAGDAFHLLDSVRFADATRWQIVYEPAALVVHFKSKQHPAEKSVALGPVARDCRQPALMMSMEQDEPGDAGVRWQEYKDEDNLALVEATLAPLARSLPPGIAGQVAAQSRALTRCTGQ